jgi:hypothetical protein
MRTIVRHRSRSFPIVQGSPYDSALAITCTSKSFVVVGTISLSLVRALGKTSSAIAPSGFAWATIQKRMTETAAALAVVSAGGFVTTTVFRPGGGSSQY